MSKWGILAIVDMAADDLSRRAVTGRGDAR